MGRGTTLTSGEQAVINAYEDAEYSNQKIAEKVKRRPKVINNYFKLGSRYGKNYIKRGNPKISSHDFSKCSKKSSNCISN